MHQWWSGCLRRGENTARGKGESWEVGERMRSRSCRRLLHSIVTHDKIGSARENVSVIKISDEFSINW